MSKKGENIRKRADGRWEGRYRNGYGKNGRPRYSSVYGKTYGEVRKKLSDTRNAKNVYSPLLSKSVTFGDASARWLNANGVRLKEATKSKYAFMLNRHILPYLAPTKLSELDPTQINLFLKDKLNNGSAKGKGLSPSYVRTMAIIIGAVMGYASSEGLCPPVQNKIYKPKATKKKVAVLSKTDLQRLETHLNIAPPNIKLGILICLNTGLRIGELCALSKKDIDLKSKVINVNRTVSKINRSPSSFGNSHYTLDTPKTETSLRAIPINSSLYPHIKTAIEQNKNEYLVSDTDGFMSPARFYYHYKAFLKKAGLPPINFHALRHTFATQCVNAGVDIKTLSTILGHSSVAVTLDIYVHPSEENTKRQLEKLCSVFKP